MNSFRRAPKPKLGPLSKRVVVKRSDRARANESALVQHEIGAPEEWTAILNGMTFTLSLPSGLDSEMRMTSNGLLRVLVIPRVTCIPTAPILKTGPHEFINPPLMVEDGTFHETTDYLGRPTLHANFKEDPQMALKIEVTRLILGNNAKVVT